MNNYLTIEEACKLFVEKVKKDFCDEEGNINFKKAALNIFNSTRDRYVKDIEFAIKFPAYSLHVLPIWEKYMGLNQVKVFERNGRVNNRNSSKSDGERTSHCEQEVSRPN